MFNKLKKFLKSKRAVGSVATAIKVGTACVLGATVLVGGVALTNDVVLPNTNNQVASVADYEGDGASGESNGGVENVELEQLDANPNLLRFAKVRNLPTEADSIFKECSMRLDDGIGLNFTCDLSSIPEEDVADAYMQFSVTQGSASSSLKTACVNPSLPNGNRVTRDSNGYYVFLCPLRPVDIAETVTPVLHYGDNTVIGPDYSVKQHIDLVNENADSYNTKTITLINAIGNYGYHAQKYFTTVVPKPTALANTYATRTSYSELYSTYSSELQDKAIVATGITKGSNNGQYQQNANFDSSISPMLQIKASSGLTVNSTYPGETRKVASNSTTYILYLYYIPVYALGNQYEISGTINGTTSYSIKITGLSYIKGALDNGSFAEYKKDFMCAVYEYYLAAVDYVNTYGSPVDYSPVSPLAISNYVAPSAPLAP